MSREILDAMHALAREKGIEPETLMIALEDGRRAAVRPSGTEPKIKFYLFAHRTPPEGRKFSADELRNNKREVMSAIDTLWAAIKDDVQRRIAT